jgi:hypothetical protein
MIDMDDAAKDVTRIIEKNKARVQEILNDADFLDDDGYPTDSALEAIRKWHWDDIPGWFKFIESIWAYRNWGWKEIDEPHTWKENKMVHRYYISTAGWSGNEDIIRAMQKNDMMWHLNWVQSRRGGHYIFELKEFEE